MKRWRLAASMAALAVTLSGMALIGAACSGKTPREAKRVEVVTRDVPEFLRGTIGTETELRGADPILVSGLGLVVGLNGTGGGELPPNVAATMEREMSLRGIGSRSQTEGGELEGVSPAELLRSRNVAVVIVEAQLAPGAPEGSRFDVFVRTLPGSGASSLEGGKLWTTELRIGPAAVFGARKTRKLAEASGPVYVNPFSDTLGGAAAEAIDTSKSPVTRTVGRVLNGGVVTDALRLEIVLDNPSHSRARSMVSVINQRFPRNPELDRSETATGRSGDSVALRIPAEYARKPAEFIQLVRYLRVDPSYPDAAAARYIEALKSQPGFAEPLTWSLAALGEPAKRQLLGMYDYGELGPRMAALQAGALLGDPRTVSPLIDIAKHAPDTAMRLAAIDLVGRMGGRSNPGVNFALRELMEDPRLEIRVACYEALSRVGDPLIDRHEVVGTDGRTLRFIAEQVPSERALVYVTQQGEPRIALFGGRRVSSKGEVVGEALKLNRPMLATMWGDRLMFRADQTGEILVRYDDQRSGKVTKAAVPEDVGALVQFLARQPTPEDPRPGLGLGYSEVVGVLYELTQQGALNAAFATEEDKLRAQVFAAAQATLVSDRPEDSDRAEDIATQVWRPMEAGKQDAGEKKDPIQERRSRIVPLGGKREKK